MRASVDPVNGFVHSLLLFVVVATTLIACGFFKFHRMPRFFFYLETFLEYAKYARLSER